jgi:pyridoxine 5'-phosphate synthase PdxJ
MHFGVDYGPKWAKSQSGPQTLRYTIPAYPSAVLRQSRRTMTIDATQEATPALNLHRSKNFCIHLRATLRVIAGTVDRVRLKKSVELRHGGGRNLNINRAQIFHQMRQ